MLVTAIFMSVQLLFAMIMAFMPSASTANLLNSLGLGQYSGGVQLSSSLASIPLGSILILIGVWITYGAAKKASDGPIATGGLTMIKVVTVISLVGVCIIALLVVIISILLGVGSGFMEDMLREAMRDGLDYSSYSALRSLGAGLAIVVFLVGALVCTFAIIFIARILSTLGAAKKTFSTGEPVKKGVSVFVAVICFIASVVTFFSAFTYLRSPVTMLYMLITTAVYILCGIVIIKYKSTVSSFAA